MCCFPDYFLDEWVDEPILGFLSIFSIEEKVATHFDYNSFLGENLHDQLANFPTKGMFQYSLILGYMFMFYQADKFSFHMQKMC
jgi:hypothetical protein